MEDSSFTGAMPWIFGLLVVAALLIAVIARPMVAIARAKITAGREEQYRAIAGSAIAVQEATERRLAEVNTELAAIRVHMAALEKVLTEVQ
jgi:hypothetical protein